MRRSLDISTAAVVVAAVAAAAAAAAAAMVVVGSVIVVSRLLNCLNPQLIPVASTRP